MLLAILFFLDIGVNVGVWSAMMMDVCKKVYAFEAHPVTFSKLQMLFLLNDKFKNYKIFNNAVSDNNDKVFFSDKSYLSGSNSISNTKSNILVQSIKIDDLLDELSIEDEYIMKVDVEGFEENVFKGAKIFLKEYKVKGIIFESDDERDADLKSLLTSYGYKVKDINRNDLYAYK
jgi:FkbM family methyltransferase